MAYFLSDDPSQDSQKADGFILQLQCSLKRKDDKIKELESKIEALHKELCSIKVIAAKTKEQLASSNKLVEIYKESSNKWYKKAGDQLENDYNYKDAIQLVQNMARFHGLPDEDPYAHIASFLRICHVFETNGGSNYDAVRLRLFQFSLLEKALWWLESLPDGPVTTWDTMAEKFISKYFPPSKTLRYRIDITDFSQTDGESLYETWDRFNDLLRRCPHHKIPLWRQVEIFYDGLSDQTSQVIVPWVTLCSKTPEDAFDLLEKTAVNDYHRQARIIKLSTQGAHQDTAITSLAAKVEALTRKMDQMQVSCELCGGPHARRDCQQGNLNASYEQFGHMGNQLLPQNIPCNNLCNMGQRNYQTETEFGN